MFIKNHPIRQQLNIKIKHRVLGLHFISFNTMTHYTGIALIDTGHPVKNFGEISVSVSASYCIPQCVRLIAGVCTHYVVYNISKKKNTVDKSKIKDKRKVKPKDKSWVKIGWRTKNRKGWCVQKR